MENLYNALTDSELVERLNAHDKDAYTFVYKTYVKDMLIIAAYYTKDQVKAEDVVQEAFLAFLHKMGSFKPRISIYYYLKKCVYSKFIDSIRYNERQRIDYVESFTNYINEGDYPADATLIENDLKQRIEREIANLPPITRKVFEMSRKGYLKNKEIAEKTETAEGTVKKQLGDAIKKLKSRLTCFFFLYLMLFIVASCRIIS